MNSSTLMTLLPLVLIFGAMYFLLIRPQKKREKEVNTMRNNIQVGDEIVTIGGICGKVVKTKDESVVIQVGADKVKFEMMRWSISKIVNASERLATEAKEDKEEKARPKKLKKAEVPAEEVVVEETAAAEEAPVVETAEEVIETEETVEEKK